MRDKKGLGVTGINYVPLLPQVEALKAGLTVDKEDNGATALGATTKKAEPVDSDGDSEMEDAPEADSDSDSNSSSSDSDSDSDDEDSAPEKKVEEKPTKPIAEVEPNPYFVVDTEPTPVNLPTTSSILPTKKGKKRAKDEETIEKKVKQVKKSKAIELAPDTKEIKRKESSPAIEPKKSKKAKIEKSVVEEEKKEVDFHALQAQLQAEVDVGEATKEVEALGESKESKKERKRRRSSDGLSKEGKKVKKEKGESRKRKAEEEEEGGKRRKA